MLNFGESRLSTGQSALGGDLYSLRLCDRLPPMTDRRVLESMIRDQGLTTKVPSSSQDLTSIRDEYVLQWMGEDAMNGLCLHPPGVQSYVCRYVRMIRELMAFCPDFPDCAGVPPHKNPS